MVDINYFKNRVKQAEDANKSVSKAVEDLSARPMVT